MFVSIESKQNCGVLGSAFSYSQYLVLGFPVGKV